jgi:hypothetical protein
MKKLALAILLVFISCVAIVIYYSKSKLLLTQAGIIYWLLGFTCLFFLSSCVILILVFLNERRRLGRQEVRHLLGKWSMYGPAFAAKRCADEILLAISSADFDKLSRLQISNYVIDHYVDYRFNVKLYNYVNYMLRKNKIMITNAQVDGVLQSVGAWRSQCPDVEKYLDACVRGYEGVEKDIKYRRAKFFWTDERNILKEYLIISLSMSKKRQLQRCPAICRHNV